MKNIKKYFELQLVILVFVLSTIISKVASAEEFLSYRFVLCYGLLIFVLFIYAILWQQMLKRFPLTIAYLNKATAIIWTMLFGVVLFDERISITNAIGAVVVIIGIVIIIKGEQINE